MRKSACVGVYQLCWSSFLILKCFNNSKFFKAVCISWTIKCWILLMHGVTMKFKQLTTLSLVRQYRFHFIPLPLIRYAFAFISQTSEFINQVIPAVFVWIFPLYYSNAVLVSWHPSVMFKTHIWRLSDTRWFKYDRDWFVCKQAALRSSCATLKEWSHDLHPPSCSG